MKAKSIAPIKVIAIVGTTASGKSDLAVQIARAVRGEIVSADSRQIYKGLDIGSGKITHAEMRGIRHHLLDVADPRKVYTVSDYQRDAAKALADIVHRGKVPIVCGGTGFYIDAVLKGIVFPDVPPNAKLRASLEKKSLPSLLDILKKLDAERAKTIDANNPRRLIRAIEIAKAQKKTAKDPQPALNSQKVSLPYSILTLGISPADIVLRQRIWSRLKKRFKEGMLEEAIGLHKNGLSWKRMEALGLEYRYMARFLQEQKRLSKKKDKKAIIKAYVSMVSDLETEIWHYAKRQRTWFRRDKDIRWNVKNPIALAKAFLKKGPKMLG